MTHVIRHARRALALASLVVAPIVADWSPAAAGPEPTSPPDGPALVTTSRLLAVDAAAADDAWSVGEARTDGVVTTLIEHWDGSTWSQVDSPNPGGSYGTALTGVVALAVDDAWAVGSYGRHGAGLRTLVLHWNGVKWRQVTSPNPSAGGDNQLRGVTAADDGDVWAIGSTTSSSLPTATLTIHWDGSSWSLVPSPNPSKHLSNVLHGVTAISARDVWTVGSYMSDLDKQSTLAAHWNGKRWFRPTTPSPGLLGNQLLGVSAAKSKFVWAVGDSTTLPTQAQPLIERWNGRQWKVVAGPDLGGASASLSGVSARSRRNAWAVGSVVEDGLAQTLTVHWDGVAWTAVPSPSPGLLGNTFSGVLTAGADSAWAVGSASDNEIEGERLISAWDGSSWALY